MQLVIVEILKIGLLEVPLYPSHMLFWVFWGSFAVGGLVQYACFKRVRRNITRWGFAAFLVAGLWISEIGYQICTGWDRLLPVLTYWWCLTLLLGAAVCLLICRLAARRRQ